MWSTVRPMTAAVRRVSEPVERRGRSGQPRASTPGPHAHGAAEGHRLERREIAERRGRVPIEPLRHVRLRQIDHLFHDVLHRVHLPCAPACTAPIRVRRSRRPVRPGRRSWTHPRPSSEVSGARPPYDGPYGSSAASLDPLGVHRAARCLRRDPVRAVRAGPHEPSGHPGGGVRPGAGPRARPGCLFRLPQQRDRVALVHEHRPGVVARAARRRRGARHRELLGVGSPPARGGRAARRRGRRRHAARELHIDPSIRPPDRRAARDPAHPR